MLGPLRSLMAGTTKPSRLYGNQIPSDMDMMTFNDFLNSQSETAKDS